MVRRYEGVVSDDLLEQFSGWRGARALDATLLTYLINEGTLEAALTCASLFWPPLLEDDDLVFLAEFYHPEQLPRHRARFGNDRSRIERFVNAMALADFFFKQHTDDSILDNVDLLNALGRALQFFWSMRLQVLFPDRQFIVEVGDNLEGENGPTITFYEAPLISDAQAQQ